LPLVTGAYDFIGMNHYTTNVISQKDQPNYDVSYEADQDIDTRDDPCWQG
jgi:lactase-phlorizin hydrolase